MTTLREETEDIAFSGYDIVEDKKGRFEILLNEMGAASGAPRPHPGERFHSRESAMQRACQIAMSSPRYSHLCWKEAKQGRAWRARNR